MFAVQADVSPLFQVEFPGWKTLYVSLPSGKSATMLVRAPLSEQDFAALLQGLADRQQELVTQRQPCPAGK